MRKILFLFLFIAACSNNPPGAQVCLSIFSGMPDPCWNLTIKQSNQLIEMIKEAPDGVWKNNDVGLGYRSINVFFYNKTELSKGNCPTSLTVFDELMSYNKDEWYMLDSYGYFNESNPNLIYKQDPGREIEKWLLETGKDSLEPQIYKIAKETIQ
jgi:hypothetical protein